MLWFGVALGSLLGAALWVLLMSASVRRYLGVGLLTFLLALGTLAALVGGLERALPLLLIVALALGLFLPPTRPGRAPRVAPRERAHVPGRKVARMFAAFAGTKVFSRDLTSPLDLWDIPGYEVLERVGTGGMAGVYRARRKRDGETVALKILAESFVAEERFIRRFHREAEVAQRFKYPNIVRTFEHGSVGAKHFIAMEFIDGCSLETYLDRPENRGNYAVSCELMRQAVRALTYIHAAGVVHRDIKPANLMLRRRGFKKGRVAPDTLKLMDFGIAGGQLLSKLTMTGARVGTPTYMSPEQARGLRSDERSDVYSLGLVFYELLSGQSAFRGGYEVVLHQQIFQLPPSPRQHDLRIPVQLERLVMRMIQKEPEARPSLAEIEYRLCERFDPHEPRPKSRLLCALGTPQGALKILDTGGHLHNALENVGAVLPAPPQACAGDRQGNLYVAVTESAEATPMIHKLSPEGVVLSSFGPYGTRAGEFLRPVALATAPDGSVWVLDAETHRVEHFSPDGLYLGGFGGTGDGEGRFNNPRDLLVDLHGDLFVLDYGNRQVQSFSPEGGYKNRWAFRAASAADGSELRQLSGFTLGGSGDLYLREAGSGKMHRIAPRGGTVDTLTLSGERDAELGTLIDTRPDTIVDLGVDDAGNLFAAERGGSAIRKYAPSGELLTTLETYAPILQLRVDVST